MQRLIEKEREVSEWTLTEWIRRFTFNYQFAQRMYFRATAEFAKERPFFELPIVQEEPSLALSVEKTRRVFGLFAYEYFPESTLFVVYNNSRDEAGDTEQILFVKLSYLFKVGLF